MSSVQVSDLQNVKQFVPREFRIEHSLLFLFIVVLALEKWLSRAVKNCRFRDREVHPKCLQDFDSLPGPSSLPFIGSLLHLKDLRTTIDMLHSYGRRFGTVIRFDVFQESFVILNSAPMAQILLQSTEFGHIKKSPLVYDLAAKDIIGNGVITSTGEHWKSQRRLLNASFSFKSFQNYCRLFVKYSSKLVQDLEEAFPAAQINNFQPKQISSTIHLSSIQIISEAVMGLELCNDKDGYIFYEMIKRAKEIFAIRTHKPYLMVDLFWKLHPLSREFNKVVETINSITRKMITITKQKVNSKDDAEGNKTEKEEAYKGKTMIEEMLKADMSDSDILYEVNTMIFAGFETTSAATHYLMFLLALNPEHQKLCREEIDAVLADPMKCPNGELTYTAITDLKYTERCFNEALRLFPPIFAFVRKLERPLRLTDTLIIPKGINAVLPPMTLHMNPEYFPNPRVFDPDRFLPENNRLRHPYAFIPFSAGSRNCIGSKFAIMAAKTMAAKILRHFEIYTTDKINDVNLLPNIFLTPERDYNFILLRRQGIP